MPQIPDEQTIDAGWFNQCFQAAGIDAEVHVILRLNEWVPGKLASASVIPLTYATASADAPSSLVGKFPSDDPSSRATGVALQNFLKEVRFYQQLQNRF